MPQRVSWAAIGSLVLIVLITISYQVTRRFTQPQPTSVRLCLVEGQTAYGAFGRLLKESLSVGDESVSTTAGSFDTILRLERSNEPAVGIVQADVLYHYLHGGHPQFPVGRQASKIRAVARLFPEWTHLRRQDEQSDIDSVSELRVGPRGSGSFVTALNVSSYLAMPWRQSMLTVKDGDDAKFEFFMQSPSENSAELREGNPAFFTESQARIMSNALGGSVYFMVDPCELRRKGYEVSKDAAYNHLVSVEAILVATNNVSTETVDRLQATLSFIDDTAATLEYPRSNSDVLAKMRDELCRIASIRSITDENRYRRLPIATHPHIQAKRLNDPVSRAVLWFLDLPIVWPVFSLLPLLVGTIALAKSSRERLFSSLSFRNVPRLLLEWRDWLIGIVAFLVVHFLIAAFIWHAEFRSLSPQPTEITKDVWSAVQWIWHLLTLNQLQHDLRSEYSLFWVAILRGTYWVSGITMAAVLTKTLADRLPKRRMMDHTLIIGWREGAEMLVKDLTMQGFDVVVVVFSKAAKNGAIAAIGDVPVKIELCSGIEDCFEKVDAEKAKRVVVLGDRYFSEESRPADVDTWVLRCLHQLQDVLAEDTRVIAEVQMVSNVPLVKKYGCEGVCVESFGTAFLARSASASLDYLPVLKELLHFKKEDNEFYFYDLKNEERQKAKTLTKLITMNQQAVNNGTVKPCIIIGVVRVQNGSQKILINPPKHHHLRNTDRIIVIARTKPDALLNVE